MYEVFPFRLLQPLTQKFVIYKKGSLLNRCNHLPSLLPLGDDSNIASQLVGASSTHF